MAAELWSATSYKRLREQALTTERWNRLHPTRPRAPRVTELLEGDGPVVAVTDFMKAVPDQIARWVPPGAASPLGTDGFGRSDRPCAGTSRHRRRRPLAARPGTEVVQDAIDRYDLDPEHIDPGSSP